MNPNQPVTMYQLPNGLRIVMQPLPQSKVVVVNMMYRVGSRCESPTKTGLAHLLEHVMCAGSQHIPNYDQVLQNAGAESNAYTSFDVTNYWSLLPTTKLSHALWVESERMFFPNFSDQVIQTQQKVVIEEFKETVLARPYGDVWHHLLPAVYRMHPYQWPIIGKCVEDIAALQPHDIRTFAANYYHPANAVLTMVGGFVPQQALEEVKRWFSEKPQQAFTARNTFPLEAPQREKQRITVRGKVPQDALYMAYRMEGYAADTQLYDEVISHMLADGKSSLLYHHLVEQKAIYTTIHAYTLDTLDPGLFVIEGKLVSGVSSSTAENAVREILERIANGDFTTATMNKAIHQVESNYWFDQIELVDRADDLALNMHLADPLLAKKRVEKAHAITQEDIVHRAKKLFQKQQGTVLYYQAAD